MASQKIKIRLLEAVVVVRHENVDLSIYTFYSDGVVDPHTTLTGPSRPDSIWVPFIFVSPVDCTVSSEGEGSDVFGDYRDHADERYGESYRGETAIVLIYMSGMQHLMFNPAFYYHRAGFRQCLMDGRNILN
jgi:hypothetical protein